MAVSLLSPPSLLSPRPKLPTPKTLTLLHRRSLTISAAAAEGVGTAPPGVEESVRVLKKAAKTRKVPAPEVLAALAAVKGVKAEPSSFLETLGGTESPGRTWMLIFTAQGKLDKGRYFPVTAVQRFDAAVTPVIPSPPATAALESTLPVMPYVDSRPASPPASPIVIIGPISEAAATSSSTSALDFIARTDSSPDVPLISVEASSLLEDFEITPLARPPADPALTEQSQIRKAQLISLLERPVDQLHQDDLAPVSQLLADLFPQGIAEVNGHRVAYDSAIMRLFDLKTHYTTLHQDLQSRKTAQTSILAEIATLEVRIASLRQEAAANAIVMDDLQWQIDAVPEQLHRVRAEIATHQEPLSTSDALTTFHTKRMDKFRQDWSTQLEELKALLSSL